MTPHPPDHGLPMPELNANRRIDRPAEGFITTRLSNFADRPVRFHVPTDYQPLYSYPLVVIYHADDSNEERACRLAPRLSQRNYLAVSLRGSRLAGRRDDGGLNYRWDRSAAAAPHETDYLLAAVEHARRTYHIHSERVYLAGLGEGADVAYRVGLRLADRVGGIVALNGRLPQGSGEPLFDLDAVRHLPVFIGHGIANPVVPFASARRDHRLLFTAGADVRLISYPTTHRVHPNMLRDVNRWIIGRVMANKAAARG